MANEYVYCPRLAYLEWVQGEWKESADAVAGAYAHHRVDRGDRPLPPARPLKPAGRKRFIAAFERRFAQETRQGSHSLGK